ncbi:helix-turn-helix domain-containing protein [Actinoallomurus acaciae]|uniref:Helix-turn-helix domain-containing protein n=1 Tax=Actinoallomurus acaciae TaxID=502577 RepID=A0ABV5YPU1_9ACTN
MSRAKAGGCLRLARLIVDDGWSIARAAERYEVSWPTARRWAGRYRGYGAAGMSDRSSRPHHSSARVPQSVVRVYVRLRQRLGPVQIAGCSGVPGWTVHAALRRCGLPAWLHFYNHHRPHTATDGKPPVTRLTNLPGQYT